MLRKLSRDYWPPETGQPIVRLTLALLGGPMIVVPLALLLLILADFAIYGDFEGAQMQAFGVAPYLLIASYAIALTLGLAAILLLWSLRKRSRRAYAIAGIAVGGLAAALAPAIGGPPVSPASAVPMALYFGCVLLAMRWIGGIRKPDPAQQP